MTYPYRLVLEPADAQKVFDRTLIADLLLPEGCAECYMRFFHQYEWIYLSTGVLFTAIQILLFFHLGNEYRRWNFAMTIACLPLSSLWLCMEKEMVLKLFRGFSTWYLIINLITGQFAADYLLIPENSAHNISYRIFNNILIFTSFILVFFVDALPKKSIIYTHRKYFAATVALLHGTCLIYASFFPIIDHGETPITHIFGSIKVRPFFPSDVLLSSQFAIFFFVCKILYFAHFYPQSIVNLSNIKVKFEQTTATTI